MRRASIVVCAAVLSLLIAGCGPKPEADDATNKPVRTAAPVPGSKGITKQTAPNDDLNPNWKGPADGGLGGKSKK